MCHSNIQVRDLSFSYQGSAPALQGISFQAADGESIGLIGANGAGKSTLLKILVGLETGFAGEIRVCEIPLEKRTVSQVRQRIGYVFQDAENQLFMSTVEEDVAFAPRNYGLPEEEVMRRTAYALEMTGITHLRSKPIHQLSGGEKKLASIATILSMTPEIVLMDEPSAALDPRNRRRLIRIINGLGHMKIIASHDLDFIMDTCSRVLLLSGGKLAADGPAMEILSDETLMESHGLDLPLRMQHMQ